MDSTINLLPEKNKQLKREQKRKPSAVMIEMTRPQDRVFQERVVRLEGLLAFFKKLFSRPPKLPATKAVVAPKPLLLPPLPVKPKPVAPVTKLETMQDRLPHVPAPRPPAPPIGNFLSRLFNRPEKPKPPVPRPILVVPPAPHIPKVTTVVPATVHRAPAWTPPPPAPPEVKPIVPPPAPPPAPKSFPPPIHKPPAPPGGSTEAKPLLGNSLNVNLVPEQYQPEASVKDRILAASFVGGAILLVAIVALGLYFYQQRLQTKTQSIDAQIKAVSSDIATREREDLGDALVLQQRTSDVKRVLDQHVYWDAFFQKLEGVTLPTVAYSSMSVDVAGSVTLVAQAKTYNDVGSQLLTYQRAKDFITDVTISAATKAAAPARTSQSSPPPGQSAQPAQSLVSFSVSMRVDPAIFYRR